MERPFTAPLHRLFPAQSLTGQVFFSPPDFTTVLFLLYFGCMDALIPLFLFVPETVYLLFQFPALLKSASLKHKGGLFIILGLRFRFFFFNMLCQVLQQLPRFLLTLPYRFLPACRFPGRISRLAGQFVVLTNLLFQMTDLFLQGS